jgi:hypothetical protein
MTTRLRHSPLGRVLARHYRARRQAIVLRHALRAAAIAAAALVLALAIGLVLPSSPLSAGLRLAAFLAAVVLTAGWAARATLRLSLPFEDYLERIERRFPQVRSWLRNALDFEQAPPRHTSPELVAALEDETARRLTEVPVESLAPRIEARRPAFALIGALAVTLALAALAPARVERSWATLLNPSLAAPPVRLAVEPGSVRITPGAALAVHVRVWGSAQRPRLLRDGASAPAAVAEGAGAAGERRWRFDLTQLTREEDYRVRVATALSPRYHIAMAGEPSPLAFEFEIRSPAYARLPVQRGAATRGDLAALRGARARVEVTFDRDLEALAATLPNGVRARFAPVTPRRWRGEIPIEREGDYALDARASGGAGRFAYHITPLPDQPPVIAVRTPDGDLDLPAGQLVPLEILGQDDLGLSELRLQYRKGDAAAWTDVPLARFDANPREATVATRWDASSLALLPGETASFRFELFDDNATTGRGRALSPTFELRFPSLADLYEHVDASQSGVQHTLEKAADKARELQKSLDHMSRQLPQRDTPPSGPAYERSEELKSALERQSDLSQQIDRAAQQLRESIEQATEREAFNQQLTAKLKELAQLMDQVQSPEFKEALRKMREALEKLDRAPLEQQLPQWRDQNRDMLANLERTLELLKQLRQEEKLESLAQRAAELAKQQDALNQEHEAAPKRDAKEGESQSKALAEQQQKAAEQSQALSADTREMSRELEAQPEQQALEQTAQELEQQAAPDQREAAEAAQKQQGQRASQAGKRAGETLRRANQRLMQLLSQRQKARDGADLAAVRRSAQDLVSLQRATEENIDSSAPPSLRADGLTDLSEGVSRVADSLYVLAQKSPFISQKLGKALGRAINSLSTSGKEMGAGNRERGEETGREGGVAINEAVLELRTSEQSMCKMPGEGSGQRMESPAQKMGDLGDRQSQLNRQTQRLAQRLSEQLQMTTSDQQELQRLAQDQERIRHQVEQIQQDEEAKQKLLGKLDQAQREMQEVEEALRNGVADGEVQQKQQHILSRMLDAQRSVNRRDFDPERESRPGQDLTRRSPGELPADLLRETDRLRLDLLKAEADRYPAQYRAFIETYLRALNGSPR